jgi:PAS domain S-box-containing protein
MEYLWSPLGVTSIHLRKVGSEAPDALPDGGRVVCIWACYTRRIWLFVQGVCVGVLAVAQAQDPSRTDFAMEAAAAAAGWEEGRPTRPHRLRRRPEPPPEEADVATSEDDGEVHGGPHSRRDNQRHRLEESRRRSRIRLRLLELQKVSGSVKKERYEVITAAISEIERLEGLIAAAEQEHTRLAAGLAGAKAPRVDESQLRSTLATVTIDVAGAIVGANDTFCRMLGYTRAQLQPLNVFFLIHRDCAVGVVAMLQQIIIQGTISLSTYEQDSFWLRADKTVVPVHLTISATSKQAGPITGFLFVLCPKQPLIKTVLPPAAAPR